MTTHRDLEPESAGTGGRICLTEDVAALLESTGALPVLTSQGWQACSPEEAGRSAPADAAIMLAGPGTQWNASLSAVPGLVLSASMLPGHLRLCEYARGGVGGDGRLARLMTALAGSLDDDAIAHALALLAPPSDGHAPMGASRGEWIGGLLITPNVPEDFREALLRMPCPGPNERCAAVASSAWDPALWRSLADGQEVLCLGGAPLAGLGLTHDALTPDDLPAALASLAAARLNRRDLCRKAIATDLLFNTAGRDDAGALAALVDRGLRDIVPWRRRSVSIVITSHNYRDFVETAIASALGQSVPAREVVVVDDGSTDGSADIVAATPGIVPVLRPNGGQAAAMNAGFQRTRGELVLFLDADDRLRPDAIDRIGMAASDGASRIFFRLETIDPHGRPAGLYTPGTEGMPAASGMLAGALAADGIFPFVPTSGNVFPRHVLDRLLPMPEAEWRICADLWLVLAAAPLGDAMELPEVLGQYRVHGANAHFRELGAEPYARKRHLQRRRVAWKGLLERLPSGTPQRLAETLRIGLHRHILQSAAEVGPRHVLRELPRALQLAWASRGLATRARLAHGLLPLRLALGKSAPGSRGYDPATTGDPLTAAGAATWPRLGVGEAVSLAAPSPRNGLFGRGWRQTGGRGVQLIEAVGTLGFRVPDIGCNWRLRLAFEVDGAAPLMGVRAELNGTEIDKLDLHVAGTIDLRLPAELMLRWRDLLGGSAAVTGDAWTRGGVDLAACLTLHTDRGDVRRLRVIRLQADPLTATRAHAPGLGRGRFLSVAAGAADERAVSCLGRGWDWADGSGVPLTGEAGELSVGLGCGGAHAVTFLWGDPAGEGGVARPSERLMISLNDAMVPAHPSADGRQLTVEIPEAAACAEGRVRLRAVPFADPQTGGWPLLRLLALRLDRLDTGAQVDRRSALFPNLPVPAGALADARTLGVRGLVADGTVARIADRRIRLPLVVPPEAGPARLHVALFAPEPVDGAFSVAGVRSETLLCSDNEVALDIPPQVGKTMVLEAEIDDPAQRCILRSLRLELRSPDRRPAKPPAQVASGWPADGRALGPRDLLGLVEHRADWHSPLDEGLWLAVHRACLVLPPLPCGTGELRVSVATLAAAGQRLRVGLGGAWAETEGAGAQTLRLAVDDKAEASRLTLCTSHLVASQAVGAGDIGMLGGAVIEIMPHRTAEGRLPRTPRNRRQPDVVRSGPDRS